MKLAIVFTRAANGVESPLVCVEVHISRGLPQLSIVGLPEAAVKESKYRVRSAILNSNLRFPTNRVVINLAPADLPKEGGRFDLPIAIGILAASGQIAHEYLVDYEFAGELALSGELRPFSGALPFAIATKQDNRSLILPAANAVEASLSRNNKLYAAKSLAQIFNNLKNPRNNNLPKIKYDASAIVAKSKPDSLDMSDIQGQAQAKRALEIAAAGRHSMLIIGPPGTGKTMLASRLPGIMPSLNEEEMIEVAAIYSICQQNFKFTSWQERPFRQPHHTASVVAMVGGGNKPKPGEISLAHQGVLFLDELPEFDRKVLEVLREPIEAGNIMISRARQKTVFSARFQLIAAMNPCPCGQLTNPEQKCRCTNEQILRYHGKISDPLLDRIDLYIQMPMIPASMLIDNNGGLAAAETSQDINQRVEAANLMQLQRQAVNNNRLRNKEIVNICQLTTKDKSLIQQAVDKLKLSARSYYKILRIARTIADLSGEHQVATRHLQEALSFRKPNPLNHIGFAN